MQTLNKTKLTEKKTTLNNFEYRPTSLYKIYFNIRLDSYLTYILI